MPSTSAAQQACVLWRAGHCALPTRSSAHGGEVGYQPAAGSGRPRFCLGAAEAVRPPASRARAVRAGAVEQLASWASHWRSVQSGEAAVRVGHPRQQRELRPSTNCGLTSQSTGRDDKGLDAPCRPAGYLRR